MDISSSSLDILCCRILIGDADPDNPIVIKDGIEITEVNKIEINDTYKKLIGTAKVSFPKGTLYKSTVVGPVTLEGKDATRVTTEIMEDGVIIEKRNSHNAIENTTFKIGQRINIKLGYNGNLKNMFDGYITAYNSDSMFEVHCENMAYKLKLKQAPKFETPIRGTTVNDLLGEKYGLLKDTGFELHTETKKYKIEIGKVKITDNFTIADILNEWRKYRVYAFLKYDADNPGTMPAIAVGRPYSSSKSEPIFPGEPAGPYKIYFDYHVAKDDLTVLKVDPKFLAVTAKGLGIDEKFFEITIRLNPEYDPQDKSSKEFLVVNTTQLSKKTFKLTGNTNLPGTRTKTKVDLSTYTVVPYTSTKIGINTTELEQEAIHYFKHYNLNGIKGNLTIFGDFGLTTAVQVELIDNRNKSKNGVYLVDEVTTEFDTGGYRQKIKLPYRIKGEKNTYGKE